MKKIFLIIGIALGFSYSYSQPNQPWQGKKCAVVITYDDAYDQQLDNAVPVLDSLGLKATFYITASSTSIKNRMNEWKKLSTDGHELGNHTLYHPCIGGAGREWLNPEFDMRHYTVQQMENEIRMTNVFLQAMDGKTKRTFAYTCGDMKIGDSSFMDGLKNEFVAARGVQSEMHKLKEINLYDVDCFVVNNNTAEEMIGWVKKAMQTNSLLVVLFHGVGGGNSLNVALPEHRGFLNFLKKNEKDIWVAPMIDVAEYIKKSQLKN